MCLQHKTLIVLAAAMLLSMSAVAKVAEHVLLYPSVDQHGDSLTLSGKITVPEHPKGVILLPHYTIASNDEVPSTSSKGEMRYLMEDYVLIMPDYIGYGITRERMHPYLRGDVTARNCVDMLLALSRGDFSGSSLERERVIHLDTISIVGFSQGAATALWCLKLLEEEYGDRFVVKGCYAGSGPYDVAVTYDDAVAKNKVGMPMVIPMLVMGTSEAYDLGLQREMFFTPRLNKHYDEYVTSKRYSFTTLYFLMFSRKVSTWLTAYGADKSNPETRRMYDGLLRSSLVHYPIDDHEAGQEIICPEWRPQAPVYIFHSYDDAIVTFHCAEHLQRCWQGAENVTYDFGHYGSHMRSMMTFFPKVIKLLAEK